MFHMMEGSNQVKCQGSHGNQNGNYGLADY